MCLFKKKKKDVAESKSAVEPIKVEIPQYSMQDIDNLLERHKKAINDEVESAKKEIEEYTNKFVDLYPKVKNLMAMFNKCMPVLGSIQTTFTSNGDKLLIKLDDKDNITSFVITKSNLYNHGDDDLLFMDSLHDVTYNYIGGVILPSFEKCLSSPLMYPLSSPEFKETYTHTLELLKGVEIYLFSRLQGVEEFIKLSEENRNKQDNK